MEGETIRLKNINEKKVIEILLEHIDDCIVLIESDFFNFSNGQWIGSRDKNGILQDVGIDCKKWKRKRLDKDV